MSKHKRNASSDATESADPEVWRPLSRAVLQSQVVSEWYNEPGSHRRGRPGVDATDSDSGGGTTSTSARRSAPQMCQRCEKTKPKAKVQLEDGSVMFACKECAIALTTMQAAAPLQRPSSTSASQSSSERGAAASSSATQKIACQLCGGGKARARVEMDDGSVKFLCKPCAVSITTGAPRQPPLDDASTLKQSPSKKKVSAAHRRSASVGAEQVSDADYRGRTQSAEESGVTVAAPGTSQSAASDSNERSKTQQDEDETHSSHHKRSSSTSGAVDVDKAKTKAKAKAEKKARQSRKSSKAARDSKGKEAAAPPARKSKASSMIDEESSDKLRGSKVGRVEEVMVTHSLTMKLSDLQIEDVGAGDDEDRHPLMVEEGFVSGSDDDEKRLTVEEAEVRREESEERVVVAYLDEEGNEHGPDSARNAANTDEEIVDYEGGDDSSSGEAPPVSNDKSLGSMVVSVLPSKGAKSNEQATPALVPAASSAPTSSGRSSKSKKNKKGKNGGVGGGGRQSSAKSSAAAATNGGAAIAFSGTLAAAAYASALQGAADNTVDVLVADLQRRRLQGSGADSELVDLRAALRREQEAREAMEVLFAQEQRRSAALERQLERTRKRVLRLEREMMLGGVDVPYDTDSDDFSFNSGEEGDEDELVGGRKQDDKFEETPLIGAHSAHDYVGTLTPAQLMALAEVTLMRRGTSAHLLK